jgi:hypothetical protein
MTIYLYLTAEMIQIQLTLYYVASRPAIYLNSRNTDIVTAREFFYHGQDCSSYPFFVKGNFVHFAGKRIYFSSLNDSRNPNPVDSDIVVITAHSPPSDISEIWNSSIPQLLVIDSSVPGFRREKIIEQCVDAGVEYHDVSTSGAFIVSANQSSAVPRQRQGV